MRSPKLYYFFPFSSSGSYPRFNSVMRYVRGLWISIDLGTCVGDAPTFYKSVGLEYSTTSCGHITIISNPFEKFFLILFFIVFLFFHKLIFHYYFSTLFCYPRLFPISNKRAPWAWLCLLFYLYSFHSIGCFYSD